MDLTLKNLVEDLAEALVAIDSSRVPFRNFSPGVGPYGEPQLLTQVAARLNAMLPYEARICAKRTPESIGSGTVGCRVQNRAAVRRQRKASRKLVS